MDESEISSPTIIAPSSHISEYDLSIIQLLEDEYGVSCAHIFLENATPNIQSFIGRLNPEILTSVLRQSRKIGSFDLPFPEWNQQISSAYEQLHIHRESGHVFDGTLRYSHQNPNSYKTTRTACCPCSVSTSFPNPNWTFAKDTLLDSDYINNYSPPVSPQSSPQRIHNSMREIWENEVHIFAPAESFGPSFAFGSLPLLTSPLPAVEPRISLFENQNLQLSPVVDSIPAPVKQTPPVPPLAKGYGRGILIKNLPVGITLREICANIAGGDIERIDFQDGEDRNVVGVYFTEAEAAEKYRLFVNHAGGICWGSSNRSASTLRSFVEAIPAEKGGLEMIKTNISRALAEESATRCLGITNLGHRITRERLISDINQQSKHIKPAYDICEVVRTNPLDFRSKKKAIIRLASVGTALGARLMLSRNHSYKQATIRFLPDPCNTPLEPLGVKWREEDEVLSLERLRLSRVGRHRGSGNRARIRGQGESRALELGNPQGESLVAKPESTQVNIANISGRMTASDFPALGAQTTNAS